MAKKKPEIQSLYYITHIDNLTSILNYGILSHYQIKEKSLPYTPIYDAEIASYRKDKKVPNGRSLWHFANLYFQPRNPMLYRVVHEKGDADIVVLGIQPKVLHRIGVFIANGNAACGPTDITPVANGLEPIYRIWALISSPWWNPDDGSKRMIMAECLVPDYVPPDLIYMVYVANEKAAEKVNKLALPKGLKVSREPNIFFRPKQQIRITDKMLLADGDMFFSNMQTLTVSVNTMGIMGKGLASRCKYQFPDVYIVYQDACRTKDLRPGKPHLYKREAFVDKELADEPDRLLNPDAQKWFLLFPTKRHWEDRSNLKDIEEGLQWIKGNYKTEGIQSLAIPALGCGLGKLEWKVVGPTMCKKLSGLDIQVIIYLPQEHHISNEFLSRNYLLA